MQTFADLEVNSLGREVIEKNNVLGAVIVVMNVENNKFVVVNLQNPRKRKRNEAAWQKNRAKHGRYSGKGKLFNVLSALLYFDVVEILFSDSCVGQNKNFDVACFAHAGCEESSKI